MKLAKTRGQLGFDGLAVDDEGDPDGCTVCQRRMGRFTTVVVRGVHKIVCKDCAQSGWAPTLAAQTA